jgi:hypothetical protein
VLSHPSFFSLLDGNFATEKQAQKGWPQISVNTQRIAIRTEFRVSARCPLFTLRGELAAQGVDRAQIDLQTKR